MKISEIKESVVVFGSAVLAVATLVGTCGGLAYLIERPSAEAQVRIDESNKLFPIAYKKAAGSDGILTSEEEKGLITGLGIESLVLRENDVVTLECNNSGNLYAKITNPGVLGRGYTAGQFVKEKFYKFDIQKLRAYVGDEK